MIPYDIAAALATATARLADTLDDGRDGHRRHYSAYVRVLLDLLDTDHTTDDPHTAAIINRAIDAPWFAFTEDYNDRGEFACYSVAAAPDGWTDPREPSIELRSFLQSARLDVLTLAAEIRRLRLLLNQWPADDLDGWGCTECGGAYIGTAPDDGLCRECRQAAPA
jgi:hypothetical protein